MAKRRRKNKKRAFFTILFAACLIIFLASKGIGKYSGMAANKKIIDDGGKKESVQAVVNDSAKNEGAQAAVNDNKPVENQEVNKKPIVDQPTEVDNTSKDKAVKTMVDNPDDILVLVNKERNLSAGYVPKDLVVPNVTFAFKEDSPRKYMRQEAARALEELFNQAKKDNINIVATSGYRSYETQKRIFESNAKKYGEKVANRTSAYPGQSEHQTGLAMDLTSARVGYDLVESFGDTVEGKWLKDNAVNFGFIIRYPKGKEDITGYQYEPWHIRYVGKEVAKAVTDKNITFEEYYNTIQ